jgi:polyphosphate glucokinase
VEVLVIDIGGTRVKFGNPGRGATGRFKSGPALTPDMLVHEIKERTGNWQYDVVSIGYPGGVSDGRPIAEPGNLGPGWVGFDFETALGRPVRVVNDAVLQAIGAYREGRMLFLGFGTGVGSALVSESVLIRLELGCLPHVRGGTLADLLGRKGRHALGHDAWQGVVREITPVLREALAADYVVLGGGNGPKVLPLPPDTFPGGNDDAFEGGVRLWEDFVQPHDGMPEPVWRVVR